MPQKARHVPNLRKHHTSCGLNYSLLLRLARRFGPDDSLQFVLPFGGQDCLVRMRFTDLGPYTGLCESQCSLLRGGCTWVPLPAFTVRLYHDMQLAEVTDESSSDFIQGAYPYPNPSMVQPNEREQLDQFLSEWLSYCLHHGLADLSAYGINTNELSVKDIIKIIEKLEKKNIKIITEKKRVRPDKSEVLRLTAHNLKSRKLLNWAPEVNNKREFEKFLTKTIKWFRANRSKYKKDSHKYSV